jgi:hypothetical protein
LHLRLRLDPSRWLGPRLHLRLNLRRRLRFYLRLHLGLRPRLGFCLRRSLGLNLRRFLGLPGGATALQSLVFSFLLPPLLRRQALGPGGQRRSAGLHGPGNSRCGCRPRPDTGVEFSRFDLTGCRATGLHLARLAGYDGLPRSRSARRDNLSRFSRGGRLPRSGLGRRRRFEGLRLPRFEPLLRGQFLNLLGHLGGQGHGGLAGQSRARQTATRLQRRGLDPGNIGGKPGHIFGRRHEVGPVQVNLGHFGVWRQPGWRQALALRPGPAG